jgi:methyl-accepting chemotaxis protein
MKNYRITLRSKLILGFAGLALICAGLFCTSIFLYYRSQLRSTLRESLRSQVGISALHLDGDAHARLLSPADKNGADYTRITSQLMAVYHAASGIANPYTMRAAPDGKILLIVDTTEEDPAAIGDVYEDPGPALKGAIQNLDHAVVEDDFYTDQWGTWLSGYAPIRGSDGRVVGVLGIDISADTILGQERRLLWIALGLLLVSTLIATGLAVWISGQLTRPILAVTRVAQEMADRDLPQLAAALEAIASNDLTAEVEFASRQVDCRSRDEIGDLAAALNGMTVSLNETGTAVNAMTADLRGVIGAAVGIATRLQSRSEQMAASSSQAGQTASQIAATIVQVAGGVSQQTDVIARTAGSVSDMSRAIERMANGALTQAEAVAQASTITSQISAAVDQVASNAQAVSQNSAEAAGAARQGVKTVEDTIYGMQKIKTKVDLSARKMQEMGARSDQIGAIVETIDDIASQTNLLALNAAIEAARAGEHGKGFAVVADEVRKLAERSSSATKEIGGLIKGIQVTVQEAVKAMNEGAGEVEDGVRKANQAGGSLESILTATEAVHTQAAQAADAAGRMKSAASQLVESMDIVSAVVDQNAAGTEVMSANSSEVTGSIENIASVAEENSVAVEELNAGAEEMSAQAAQVAEAARRLAEMAQELNATVAKFRLGDPGDSDRAGDGQPLTPVASGLNGNGYRGGYKDLVVRN